MATRKYPPQGDAELLAAGEQFDTNSAAALAAGLTAADIARFTAAFDAAKTDYETHTQSQQKARTDRITKDNSMDALAAILSEFNKRLQPTADEPTLDKVGFPIYDKTRTPAAAPSELPVVKIDTAMPMTHLISFADADGKGKPEGVKALEIHVKIGGDATGNLDDYRFLTQDTETPYLKQFTDIADAGKQAHYMCRWVNSKGEGGAFVMESATITSDLQTGRA